MWDAIFKFVFGDTDPVYVTVRDGDVFESRELIEGEVIGDFDAEGRLLGVEVLR